MSSGSLRLRVGVVAVVVVAVALGGFASFVTLRYRDGLNHDLRTRLISGATVLRHTPEAFLKQAVHTLALQGIGVDLRSVPSPVIDKAGTGGTTAKRKPAGGQTEPASIQRRGTVLMLEEPLSGSGVAIIATLSASTSALDSSVSRLVTAEVAGGLIVMLVVSALLAWWLRIALAPLEHVGRVAEMIAAGGREQRLNPRRPGTDLGRMAASFDAMVMALDKAAKRAEASEVAMRTFLASAAHELRAPLAALQATIETLLREQPVRPERDRLEARLAREGARLGRLVHDLLDLARLEAVPHRPTRRVELADIVKAAIQDATAGATAPRVHCDIPEAITVIGEPETLQSAVRNLLDNATSANAGAGGVRVKISRNGADALVQVCDDGPGVPEEDRQAIFEPFRRLASSPGGHAGLGLAIVARIAEQHGGAVSCDPVSRGAMFTLRLPAGHPQTSRVKAAASGEIAIRDSPSRA